MQRTVYLYASVGPVLLNLLWSSGNNVSELRGWELLPPGRGTVITY